jgi:hypothetical protein
MSDGHKEMFAAHAAEIEQARQYAESAAREHGEAREALEALRAERAATIDYIDALAPEMTAAQLAGDDEAIASLHDTFKRLTARREQLANSTRPRRASTPRRRGISHTGACKTPQV